MRYQEFVNQLRRDYFTRVERDDRLFDVFPLETREKGIELWEKWGEQDVELVRVLPYDEAKTVMLCWPREALEKLLLENKTARLFNARR